MISLLNKILIFDLRVRVMHHCILNRIIILFFLSRRKPVLCQVIVAVNNPRPRIPKTSLMLKVRLLVGHLRK
jgi:hypothetical protein